MNPRHPSVAPSTRETLRRLELDITRRLDGLLHGDYRGLVPGYGSEPGETRAYSPGDDVRRIDWNVTARTQSVHVRETIADRELETRALVDMSPSLDFGTARHEKRELAITATAAVGFLTARLGNRFGAVVLGTDGPEVFPARQGRAHLLGLLHHLVEHPRAERGTTDLAAGLHRLGAGHVRRGLALVVSDFLAPSGWEDQLRRIASRHEVLAVEVIDPRELELPDVGHLAVVDPETGELREISTNSAKLRRRYALAASEQRERIARAIRDAGADHMVLRTDRDWLLDVVRFVALRRQRNQTVVRRTR